MDQLESRTTLSVFASAGGVVYDITHGTSFRPFEQEASSVPLNISQDTTTIYVGAGVGGGPRLAAFNLDTTPKWSVFVGDPESRTGVSVSALPNPKTPMTAGDGWTVWLEGDISPDTFKGVVDILSPLHLRITTEYPNDLRPGTYTTVRLLDESPVGWRPSALGTVPVTAVHNFSLYAPTVAYAPLDSTLAIAHEIVHTIQPLNYPPHSDNPADLMYPYIDGGTAIPDADTLNKSIVDLTDGYRFGPTYDNVSQTFRYGYTQLS